MKPYPKALTFGDASKKVPKGIIERFPIMLGNCVIESDLLVVEMVDSMEQPILLGAPFLLTTGAVIDYGSRVVTLKHVDDGISYAIVPPSEFVGTIIRREAIPQPKEGIIKIQEVLTMEAVIPQATKVEVASSILMDVLDNGVKLEKEVPSFEEATSQATEPRLEVPADSFIDFGDFGLERLYDEGVQFKEAPKKVEGVKKTKTKKVKQAQPNFHEARPYNLTFKPLMLVDGKIECQVKCKGHSKPFHKVRILLDPTSRSKDNSPMVTLKMANLFGMKHDNPEPSHGGSSTRT